MQVDRPSPEYAWHDFLRPQERREVAALSKRRDEARAVLASLSEELTTIRQRAIMRVRGVKSKRERAAGI
jgi:hypothetical protein